MQINWEVVRERSKIVTLCLLPSFIRLIVTVAIIAIVAIISVVIYNSPPSQYTNYNLSFDWSFDPRSLYPYDNNFTYNILLDTHCHTVYSDGGLTPEQNILWHIANGYNAMFVTDHNTVDGGIAAQKIAREKYNDKIKVIVGMEWSNCRCHLNFIGINQTLTPIKNPTDQEIQNIINQVHDLGGLVIYNHRPWSTWANLNSPSIEQFASWGVDYFDVANTFYFDMQTLVYARDNGFGICSANDFHYGTDATGWTLLNVPNIEYSSSAPINASYFTEDDLFNAFKSRKSSLIFQVTGTGHSIVATMKENPKYNLYLPWIQLGGFFHSYYTLTRETYSFVNGENCLDDQKVIVQKKQVQFTVMWFLLIFIGCELFRGGVTFIVKLIKKKREEKMIKLQDSKYMRAYESEFGVVDTPLLNMNL
eukprot:gene2543-3146_t